MKIGKQLMWIGIIAVMLTSTAASCEGGNKKCDCPKFGQVNSSGNDAVASAAAAGTLD
ncbi:MAG TPA: hypothetical protein PKL06_00315 [Chitinophagales bacterium]|mgnify:CR=1 FL=1|nr:hypothetical protein [Chitinophagales bacterium]